MKFLLSVALVCFLASEVHATFNPAQGMIVQPTQLFMELNMESTNIYELINHVGYVSRAIFDLGKTVYWTRNMADLDNNRVGFSLQGSKRNPLPFVSATAIDIKQGAFVFEAADKASLLSDFEAKNVTTAVIFECTSASTNASVSFRFRQVTNNTNPGIWAHLGIPVGDYTKLNSGCRTIEVTSYLGAAVDGTAAAVRELMSVGGSFLSEGVCFSGVSSETCVNFYFNNGDLFHQARGSEEYCHDARTLYGKTGSIGLVTSTASTL